MGAGVEGYVDEIKMLMPGNPHLGTAILLMPLARAAGTLVSNPPNGHAITDITADITRAVEAIRSAIVGVLEGMDKEDAAAVCRAIKKMNPPGLMDPYFRDTPVEELERNILAENTTFLRWMEKGAEDDGVAREIYDLYPISLRHGAFLAGKGRRMREYVQETFLRILAENQDTFIAGIHGERTAENISRWAGKILSLTGDRREEEIEKMDRYCRLRNINPGTTADLTASSIFIGLLACQLTEGRP